MPAGAAALESGLSGDEKNGTSSLSFCWVANAANVCMYVYIYICMCIYIYILINYILNIYIYIYYILFFLPLVSFLLKLFIGSIENHSYHSQCSDQGDDGDDDGCRMWR